MKTPYAQPTSYKTGIQSFHDKSDVARMVELMKDRSPLERKQKR